MFDRLADNRQLNFAVFGDVHGRIALMYTLAILWQQQSGIELDGLLQVGDIGAFPDLSKLDKATKKHAEKDTDELGFQKFWIETPESKLYLEHQQAPTTYFVRGNHEDFEYLGNFTKPSSIDPWQKIWFIPDNRVMQVGTDSQSVKIAAFGGIAPKEEQRSRGKLAREQYRKAQKIGKSEPRFFSEHSIDRISADLQYADILMTHAGPICPELTNGSMLIEELVGYVKPRVHLFGHHHQVIDSRNRLNGSLSIGLEHLEFGNNGKLKYGSWGILSISPASLSFSFMSPSVFPLLDLINRTNYRLLLTP
jgi:Icc-related predicted phosphoesterase